MSEAPGSGRIVVETARLRLRELVPADAPLVVAILNDPDFLRYVGDRGIRNLADGKRYIIEGPARQVREHGDGMYRAELTDGTAIGICGIVRRAGLDAPDLGFALLPAHRGAGLAKEAARAALEWALGPHGLPRVLAIASAENSASCRLLERIGMRRAGQVTLPGGNEALELYEATS